ncbi:MurR/RpiR family transcriptional regulator [Microvirga brassicacearum]|uniref:MurR/RpiR family transcriptional regulator n=1 Tax=Microvirga brassicacearum TaxID=2580413 RepID=A0A5N3PE96_9HYPH|nr:MurR/RpiR family transcriptional regulator [Microvirga brassicacearum]KAB0268034.1 MurR/RpiR family transcriptional regulator [Microvirga brassicacearum]
MAHSLANQINRCRDRLTEADQRLLDVLLRDPANTAMLSASEVAREAGVHAAAAVRLAQKLGYEGYLDMRSALRSEVVASDSSRRIAETLAGSEGDLLASLVASEVDTLLGLVRHIDQAAIETAAKALLKARSVILCAQGNSIVLADLLDRRLRRAGFRTSLVTGQGREFAERLIPLGRGDVLVCFAFRHLPREITGALDHAPQVGATTLLIADHIARRIPRTPDHVLAAPRGRDEEFLTLTVPMAICNALILTIARIDGGQSVSTLDALETLVTRFD